MANIGSVFWNSLLITLAQLLGVFGMLFLLGVLLHFMAKFTRTIFVKSIGYKFDVVTTGWIGVPIHEIGHAFFCIPFRHKINEIKLYEPKDGVLGYVNHSFNPKSSYQKVGNFFIGVGPILFGSVLLAVLIYFLLPHFREHYAQLTDPLLRFPIYELSSSEGWSRFGGIFSASFVHFFRIMAEGNAWGDVRTYLCLYLGICIASHMELSPPDIRGAWYGLRVFIVLLFLGNLLSLLIHFDLGAYLLLLKSILAPLVSILFFSVLLSGLNFISSYFLLFVFTLLRRRKVLTPF